MEPLLHEVDGVENRIELSVIIIREDLIWVLILIQQDLNNQSDLTPRRFICIILLRIIAYGPPFNWSVRGILRRKGASITLVESKISFFRLKSAALLWHYVYWELSVIIIRSLGMQCDYPPTRRERNWLMMQPQYATKPIRVGAKCGNRTRK